ncbi:MULTISPECIES: helix-turn-helix domain-containing protein [unclassified Campylobacter]|uniref:helix-turn-helix domain-containing protein n=1 Tax=unclassified Campylobacter TaxID=2593542 RepID=UPI001BD95596|nr:MULTISPECIES: helix-turn-helix domain-containing protein [unclassified Campylobacter]MBZ7975571.1 helix-turn-helix domain-containing protein [Campylobacter sp. RM12637]MBZ7977411.1 helix-turn-helix domain-containing protein [Campylobacter sp. RM12654]MBZ7979400.1 helix-turn-helix domain-containing protein [Campylobacter sp. RM12642]MBZ7981025.1 helix-turn-helix domain-containing protein [Campylobacter sp. RM12640]MBZ7983252.1 helix-turn-helix domain-containing protein [Campylobacter sp. RM1
MGIDLLIYIVFIIFIVLLFVYVRLSFRDLNDKLDGVLKAIDENYKSIHRLEKDVEKLKLAEINNAKQNDFNDNIMQNCEFLIHSIIDERINELNSDLGIIQESIQEVTKNQDSRIANLELANEPITRLSPNEDAERMQILKLFGDGKSVEEIALLLNKSPQAINIILKSL